MDGSGATNSSTKHEGEYGSKQSLLQCSNVVSLPDGIGDIAIPTTAFNVIYQLTHLYHHFFDEGIGMRQIIDYFLVVNDFSKNVFLDTDFENHPVPLSKEGSTFSLSPSSSGSGDVTAPSRCSEPLRSKDGGPSKVSPDCAGWDRLDATCLRPTDGSL